MGVTVGFSLQQFSEVLKIRDAAGQPYLLIGGQAVNYWAEHYLSADPQLEKLRPSPARTLISKAALLMSSTSPVNWN
jgi:hypothetical protein